MKAPLRGTGTLEPRMSPAIHRGLETAAQLPLGVGKAAAYPLRATVHFRSSARSSVRGGRASVRSAAFSCPSGLCFRGFRAELGVWRLSHFRGSAGSAGESGLAGQPKSLLEAYYRRASPR